jgi:hypothetical protein
MPPPPSPPKPAIDLEQFKALMEEKERHLQEQKRQQWQQQQLPQHSGRQGAAAGGCLVSSAAETMQVDAAVAKEAAEPDIDLYDDGDELEIIPQSQVNMSKRMFVSFLRSTVSSSALLEGVVLRDSNLWLASLVDMGTCYLG